ncbi:MAG: response regulator transcription factor [Cyclobacteriaceae bacterium]|nr:response regulator transcription factor [Cyclobacteriaceae bacterium]
MIRAILVDDEYKSRENLKMILEEYCPDVQVTGQAGSVTEAIELISSEKPELVFLDIQMKMETGFDLLESIDSINFDIIFVTAYAEFALRAIKFSAVDYVLKPVDIAEFQVAVNKVIKRRSKDQKSDSGKLEILLNNLKSDVSDNYKIALPTANGLVFVKLKNIIYLEAESNYTNFHFSDGTKIMVSRTLKEYDEMLSNSGFFRIHKSYLININEIREYVRGEGGYVIMNNNVALDVSKRKKEPFLDRISKFR